MFKPDYREEYCPICGGKLERKQFMGFGVTAGYNASCPTCGKYNDIWACGIRELDCGDWHSESFLSSYGTPTEEEAMIEKENMRKLNRLLLIEKIKWGWQRLFSQKKTNASSESESSKTKRRKQNNHPALR